MNCPECGGRLIEAQNGELVCSKCGLVAGNPRPIHRLPMDETFAPTCDLAFGKSLGFTLPKSGLHKVLAMAPEGRNDLGLRARFIQIIETRVDPPYIRNLLQHGSRLLKQLGLDEDTPANHRIANDYGKLLRIIGAFIHIAHLEREHPATRIAQATLQYMMNTEKKLADMKEQLKLKFKEKDLKLVSAILDKV